MASDADRKGLRALALPSTLAVSLVLHGGVLAALLWLVEARPGASPVLTEAISIELVRSEVLEAARPSPSSEASTAASTVESAPGAVEEAAASASKRRAERVEPPVQQVVERSSEPIEQPLEVAKPPPEADMRETAAAEPLPAVVARVEVETTTQHAPVPLADRPNDAETPAGVVEDSREPAVAAVKQAVAAVEPDAMPPSMPPAAAVRREAPQRADRKKPMKKGAASSRATKASQASNARVSASHGSATNYAAAVRARVASRKPSGPGRSGTVVVVFGVSRSGGLAFASISRSSGDTELDRIVLSAVRSAAPFPAPPKDASPRQLRFTMPFDFR